MSVKDFYRDKVDDWGNKSDDPIFLHAINKIYSKVSRTVSPVTKDTKILDLGCGTGEFSKHVYWANYYGVDISKEAIKIAKEKQNKTHKPKFYVMASDEIFFNNLECEQSYFDKVVCIEVIEHLTIPDLKKTLKEIWRVTDIGGQVVITTPNLNYLWGMLPYSILPPSHRYGIRTYIEGYKKGYVNETRTINEKGVCEPHHYRFRAKYLRKMFEKYFHIMDVTSTYWYNNRVIHGILPSIQEKIWNLSWKSKYCGAQLIFDLKVK